MRGRKVQGVNGISRMRRMQRKHVFKSRGGIDMPRLFSKLQLSSRELNLHLQCGLLGARRRQLHSVRGRKVQGNNGTSRMLAMFPRHVFNSCRGINMPGLFARLLVAWRELNLHLQRGLLGA